jgi:hypothetical protein
MWGAIADGRIIIAPITSGIALVESFFPSLIEKKKATTRVDIKSYRFLL